MNPAALYVRTDKGAAEIAQRSQAIPSKARSLLMMIDGKATGAQMLEKFAAFPGSAELLQILEDGGYIAATTGAPAVAAASPARPAAAEKPFEPVASGDLSGARRHMNQTLREMLGPDADTLTTRVDRAATGAELRALAEKHRDLIASVGGRRKGEAFWQRMEELLPAD